MEKERKEEEKKKEEEGREEEEDLVLEVWNSCLEISYSCLELWYGTSLLYGIHVWNSWICWLGNHLNSLFAYV